MTVTRCPELQGLATQESRVLVYGRDDLTDEQISLIRAWVPFRYMDAWLRDGMPMPRSRRWPDPEWPGPGYVSISVRRRWWAAATHGWACWFCSTPLTPPTITADHLTPTKRGGADDRANVRPCCQSCNSRKSNRTEEEYMAVLAA